MLDTTALDNVLTAIIGLEDDFTDEDALEHIAWEEAQRKNCNNCGDVVVVSECNYCGDSIDES